MQFYIVIPYNYLGENLLTFSRRICAIDCSNPVPVHLQSRNKKFES